MQCIAASASASAAASSKANNTCPRMTQRPSTITESTALRAAMLHQRVLSRRERQSADATASH